MRDEHRRLGPTGYFTGYFTAARDGRCVAFERRRLGCAIKR